MALVYSMYYFRETESSMKKNIVLFLILNQLCMYGMAPKKINKLNGVGYAPLHMAAIANLFTKACRYLQSGADVDVCDWRGNTPLYHAAACGNFDIVKLLFQYGANPNKSNYWKVTPRLKAAFSGYPEIAEILRKREIVSKQDQAILLAERKRKRESRK